MIDEPSLASIAPPLLAYTIFKLSSINEELIVKEELLKKIAPPESSDWLFEISESVIDTLELLEYMAPPLPGELLKIFTDNFGFTIVDSKWELDDNSLDAEATKISDYFEIVTDPNGNPNKYYLIKVDNGRGMSIINLDNFICFGTDNSSEKNINGKFGLGGSIAIMKLNKDVNEPISIVTKLENDTLYSCLDINYNKILRVPKAKVQKKKEEKTVEFESDINLD